MIAQKLLNDFAYVGASGVSESTSEMLDRFASAMLAYTRNAPSNDVLKLRTSQMRLAEQLLVHNRVHYCKTCDVYGHGRGRCEVRLRSTLASVGLSEYEVRLDPRKLQEAIRQASDPNTQKALQDAEATFCAAGKTFPPRYSDAVSRLQDARLSLATARYSPESMEQFLRFTGTLHLLPVAETCMELRFPEVCLLCDSLKHTTQNCPDVHADERNFLNELDQKGISLMEFSVATMCPEKLAKTAASSGSHSLLAISRNPQSVAQLPTAFPEGRARIVKYIKSHCVERYARGGAKRVQWEKTQLSIDNLRMASIPLHVAKYNPRGVTRFVLATGRSELRSCVDALDAVPAVCFFCGSLSHAHGDCDTGRRTERQAFLALLRRAGVGLEEFVSWAIDPEGIHDEAGTAQVVELRLSMYQDENLQQVRSDIIEFVRKTYGDALESHGALFQQWRQLEDSREGLQSRISGSQIIGRSFSRVLEVPAGVQHQLVPDPEHAAFLHDEAALFEIEPREESTVDVVSRKRPREAASIEHPHTADTDEPVPVQPRTENIEFDDLIGMIGTETVAESEA
jgi:hypothetical protein